MTDHTTTNRDTMKEISHANPYTGETLGQVFSRGPIVAADGGHDPSRSRGDADSSETDRTMKHVSHTPPNGTDDANRVFERGRVSVEEDE